MLGGLKAKKGTGDPVAREVFCDEENVAFNPTFNHMDRTAVNDTADIATESLPPLFFSPNISTQVVNGVMTSVAVPIIPG